jgi:sarcosine oxidase delta subunit
MFCSIALEYQCPFCPRTRNESHIALTQGAAHNNRFRQQRQAQRLQ